MKFEKTMLKGKVAALYRSRHSPEYNGADYMAGEPVDALEVDLAGIRGDRHYGFEARSGGRLKDQYERGQIVRNSRQWSAISKEELNAISKNLNLENRLSSEKLAGIIGINMLIEGVPNLSELPLNREFHLEGSDQRLSPGVRYLVISPHDDYVPARQEDVTLVVHAAMMPCDVQGKAIADSLGFKLEVSFPKAAVKPDIQGQYKVIPSRGIAGWVEKGGIIRPGYSVFVRVANGQD